MEYKRLMRRRVKRDPKDRRKTAYLAAHNRPSNLIDVAMPWSVLRMHVRFIMEASLFQRRQDHETTQLSFGYADKCSLTLDI